MASTSPTAAPVSSWQQFRHKTAPLASLVVFCHLRQHHQTFVSAEVPPPDGSIMKLQHERGRLSIKMNSMSGVYSEQAFKEASIKVHFFFASYEHLQLGQNKLSQPLFI